ncbi:MAG: hypothetical protein VX770_02225, partial [Candidatus Neomarinimicrobiota bacterium]|nr:hypothetical protein [Candidatus Neomarinimicrobiota bacterium]
MKSLKSIMTFLVSCCVIFSLAFTANKEGSKKNWDEKNALIEQQTQEKWDKKNTLLKQKVHDQYLYQKKVNPAIEKPYTYDRPYTNTRDCEDTDNGAVDAFGDACAAYVDFPSWCGNYDTDTFNSLDMCCACGGGLDTGSGDDAGGDDAGGDDAGGDDAGGDDAGGDDAGGEVCEDTDNGAVDSFGDACAAYADFPSWCGNYDTADFLSL